VVSHLAGQRQRRGGSSSMNPFQRRVRGRRHRGMRPGPRQGSASAPRAQDSVACGSGHSRSPKPPEPRPRHWTTARRTDKSHVQGSRQARGDDMLHRSPCFSVANVKDRVPREDRKVRLRGKHLVPRLRRAFTTATNPNRLAPTEAITVVRQEAQRPRLLLLHRRRLFGEGAITSVDVNAFVSDASKNLDFASWKRPPGLLGRHGYGEGRQDAGTDLRARDDRHPPKWVDECHMGLPFCGRS